MDFLREKINKSNYYVNWLTSSLLNHLKLKNLNLREIISFKKKKVWLDENISIRNDTRKRQLMRDQENELGLHETERIVLGRDWRNWLNSFVGNFQLAIAGFKGSSDKEGNERWDGQHDKQDQNPTFLKWDPPPRRRVFGHLFF